MSKQLKTGLAICALGVTVAVAALIAWLAGQPSDAEKRTCELLDECVARNPAPAIVVVVVGGVILLAGVIVASRSERAVVPVSERPVAKGTS